MSWDTVQNAESILFYGYGKEGKSSHEFLKKRFPEKHYFIFDQKTHPRVPLWGGIDLVVLSPGVPVSVVPKGLPVTGNNILHHMDYYVAPYI